MCPDNAARNLSQTMSFDDKPLLDGTSLQSLKALADDDDPDFVKGIVKLFLTRAPELMADIDKAIASNETKTLEKASHALKGSCGNIGAARMMCISQILEEQGRNQEINQARELFEEMVRVFALLSTELQRSWS